MDMDEKARLFTEWWNTYRAQTTRFCRLDIAADWVRLRVPAATAAAWARQGYLPGEAVPLIAAGVTPQMVADLEKIATDVAGGPEERAAQVIDRLVAAGILVDPRRMAPAEDEEETKWN